MFAFSDLYSARISAFDAACSALGVESRPKCVKQLVVEKSEWKKMVTAMCGSLTVDKLLKECQHLSHSRATAQSQCVNAVGMVRFIVVSHDFSLVFVYTGKGRMHFQDSSFDKQCRHCFLIVFFHFLSVGGAQVPSIAGERGDSEGERRLHPD